MWIKVCGHPTADNEWQVETWEARVRDLFPFLQTNDCAWLIMPSIRQEAVWIPSGFRCLRNYFFASVVRGALRQSWALTTETSWLGCDIC